MRASGPISAGHSISCLLLNPPLDPHFSVSSVYPVSGNVAHLFPFHRLHLDLTFWAVPISPTAVPSQGRLTTAVYRLGARKGEV